MKNICVYCGSRDSNNPQFPELAWQVGREIVKHQWGLVFGGGKVGMMGQVAEAALKDGGKVYGVIPTVLKREEVAHTGLTELYETVDMHSRKAKMEALSDAFLVLPGGFGTLDEFFEILTWRQLGIHDKPIILLNASGYFDGLVQFTDTAVQYGYVRQKNLELFTVYNTLDESMAALKKLLAE